MEPTSLDKDRELAQIICNDIRNGDNTSLNNWVCAHYTKMMRLTVWNAGCKARNQKNPEDILHKFYIELSTGNAFCQYEGHNHCSLETYILGRLKKRSMPEKSASRPDTGTDSEDKNGGNGQDKPLSRTSPPISLEDMPKAEKIAAPGDSLEENLMRHQTTEIRRQIINKALDILSDQPRTEEDALLIRWHLSELSYKDMAERLLLSQHVPPTQEALAREYDRIRKRFTRPDGTLSRFGKMVKQVMKEKCITEADLHLE